MIINLLGLIKKLVFGSNRTDTPTMAPPNTIQQDIHDMIYHDIILQHITCMT